MRKFVSPSLKRWLLIGVGALLIGLAPVGWRWGYAKWQLRGARAALSAGRPEVALLLLRKAEAGDPNQPHVLFLLGRALRRTGELGEAKSYLDRAAAAGWPDHEVRLQRELLLVQSGVFTKTGDALSELLSRGASDEMAEEIYEARAKGFYSTFRLGDALLCLDYWLKWRPQARQARIWRAEIHERMDLLPEAARDYRAVLEYDPADVEVRLRLADTMLPRNDAQGALAEFEKCLEISPDDPGAKLGRLKCRRRLGDLEGVSEALRGLLDRDLSAKQRADALYELGEMSLYDKDYERAIDYLKRSREADPTHLLVDQSLSTAYARLGMTELYQQTRDRGKSSMERGVRLSEITRDVVRDPRNAELRYEAGMILMAEGLKQEGAAWLKTALECDPLHHRAQSALAEYDAEIGGAEQRRDGAAPPARLERAETPRGTKRGD